MQALFVHGMGRSPLSGWPMLRRLRRAGLRTGSFGYVVALETFPAIQARLEKRISAVAADGDYVLIGHSLGGVLMRAALGALGERVRPPKHIFLLGTPLHPARLAQGLRPFPPFRWLTGDCGHFLSSAERMSALVPCNSPTTSIVGIRGIGWKRGPFGGEPNDGIVTLSEVSADWLTDQVQLETVHTLLPSSAQVARIILDRLNSLSKTNSSTPESP